MGARHKLNAVFFKASLIAAGIIGMLAGSWLVFFVVLVIALALAIHGADIRLTPQGGRRDQRKP